MNLVSYFNDDM